MASKQLNSKQEEELRQFFKGFNRFMLYIWRLGLGKWVNAWPERGGQIMVLSHIGRKSGLQRRTPLNYAIIGDDLYCTAGYGHLSDWYRNIKANPAVEVWLPEGWWDGEAEDVSESAERLPLMRDVLIASGFAAEAAGIYPKTMSDDELADATAKYCLLRIRRTTARTGAGGPGDLAWVWPVATLLLLPLALRRRK